MSILQCVARQRPLKITYKFRDFFRVNFIVGISCLETRHSKKMPTFGRVVVVGTLPQNSYKLSQDL